MTSIFRKFHSLLSPAQRISALLLLGLIFIGMVLETLGIGLVIPIVALLMQDDLAVRYPILVPVFEALGNPGQRTLVAGAMLGLVSIYVAKNFFLAFLIWRQMRFAYNVQAQLSQKLFTTYLRQPYTFHLQRNSAHLIRNAVVEVSQFINGCLVPGLLLLTEGFVLFGLASLLLFAEPLGALIVVTVLGVAAWGFYRGTRGRIARWGEARQHHEGLRIQHLQQGLGGAKDVKLLGREDAFIAQYHMHNLQSASVQQFQATLAQLPRLWLELLAVAGLATLVLTLLMQGRELTTIMPILGLFGVAAFRLLPSVNRVLGAVQSLRYGLPAINILHEELKLDAPGLATRTTTDALGFQKEIRLADISYTYTNAPVPALNQISLIVRRGESVGIIGPSGSGKSTLVDLILGLLTPDDGQVLVDGQDIQQRLRVWQDQIGYVPQSIYLTDDTLRRNIAFGLPDDQIDDAAVRCAARAAQLEEFVAQLTEGIQTVVGERGVRLSGGQRQRIGIARALYHDPAVLVLDEATSSLDTPTEREVMSAVTALHRSKTILIVAHRLSTVEQCDRLYRLERGSVVEVGTPGAILSLTPIPVSREG